MRSIPAFSKEIVDMPTVSTDDDGCRSGFLDHVTQTKAKQREAIPHMAAMYPSADELEYTKSGGNPAHPEFKESGGMKGPSTPAPFSKTIIRGEPKRTAGH